MLRIRRFRGKLLIIW